MRKLKGWDAYVAETQDQAEERCIELPLTEDESYVISFPTRRQGRIITEAQRKGDMDAMLVGLLGEQAGRRVAELSEDHPSYVLEEFLYDVMKKFGFVPDDEPQDQTTGEVNASTNGHAAGKGKSSGASRSRSSSTTKRKTASTRSSAASN